MGVWIGSVNYTAPGNIQRMREELALLPVWYAAPHDFVWVKEPVPIDSFTALPSDFPALATQVNPHELTTSSFPLMEACPWGLSPQSIHAFEEVQQTCEKIHIPTWKEAYTTLINRKTAAICLDKIREQLPGVSLPTTPTFCSSMSEVQLYMKHHLPPFMFKMLYSSSGRGLLWIEDPELQEKDAEWVTGAIRKQENISIEQGLEKKLDFAMEFYIKESGETSFEGLSLFETAGKRFYSGNRLEPQEKMQKKITEWIGEESYREVQTVVSRVLKEVYGGIYTGYLGVDMMVYTNERGEVTIHPCVEINMRYTMGMVALRIFERFVASEATGYFQITHEKEAYALHEAMQKEYPLKWKSGKLLKGYFPLCPVYPETRYRAYVIIE